MPSGSVRKAARWWPRHVVAGTATAVIAAGLAASTVIAPPGSQGVPGTTTSRAAAGHPAAGSGTTSAPGAGVGAGTGGTGSGSGPGAETPGAGTGGVSRAVDVGVRGTTTSHGAGAGGRPGGPGSAGGGTGGSGSGAGTAGTANLLSAAQSTFGGGTATWVGVAATVAWVSSPATVAGGALKVTATGSQGMWAWSGSPQSGGLTPATAGSVYGGGAVVRGAGTTLTVQPVLGFYGPGGGYLTSVWGQGTQAPAGSWATLAPVDAVAPAGTTAVCLAFLVSSSAPGQALYLESPVLSGAAGHGGAAVDGPLHVRGNQLVQADGTPVVLRGAELYGLDSSSSPASVSAAAVAAARAWGADMMRVALGEQLWLASSCAYDPAYVSAVDRAVNWITAAGMVAVLELQDSIVDAGCPAGAPQDMADAAGSVPFWAQVAARYAGNPLVVFDLYNEPHDITDALWLNGGLVTDAAGTTYAAAGMQELYDAVRGAGAGNVVMVSGNNWANSVPAHLVQGVGIAYAVHVYTCPQAVPPGCADPSPMDPAPILGQWVGLGASVPVVVSEFGWPATGDGTYNAAVIAFAAAHGWGWNAFAWDTTAPFGLVSTDPAAGPYEPTPSGMPVLAALAGLPASG